LAKVLPRSRDALVGQSYRWRRTCTGDAAVTLKYPYAVGLTARTEVNNQTTR
jgi:hypothetical protein